MQLLSDRNLTGNSFSDQATEFGLFRTISDATSASEILLSVVWDKADKSTILENRHRIYLLIEDAVEKESISQRIKLFFESTEVPELFDIWGKETLTRRKKQICEPLDQSDSYIALVKDAGFIFLC